MPLDLSIPQLGIFTSAGPAHAPTTVSRQANADVRSVGELLADADRQGRTLLLDAGAADAPGLLRSWAETVSAATDLLNAFPLWEHDVDPSRTPVERVTELATSLQTDLRTARWPGPGNGDHRLHEISQNLVRARRLVDRHGSDLNLREPGVRRDLEAARTRVMHTVYVATHGVIVALNEDGRHRATDTARKRTRATPASSRRGRYEVGPGVRWARRLGVAERILGSYLQPRQYVDALAHEQAAPVIGLPRLSEALANFDIQAHRTLVQSPSAGNLVLAARTEGMFFGATLVLARTAAETGHLDRVGVDPERLEHALTTVGEAWMGLARRWHDLMPQGARLDPALCRAAAEVRAACREFTHTGDHLNAGAVVAQRIDIAAALPALTGYIDAASDLAEATRPALRDPNLSAPGHAVVQRLSNDLEAGRFPHSTDNVRTDLLGIVARGNRLGNIPDQLVDALDGAAVTAARASARAASIVASATTHRFEGRRTENAPLSPVADHVPTVPLLPATQTEPLHR
jgi:hypothetical protein